MRGGRGETSGDEDRPDVVGSLADDQAQDRRGCLSRTADEEDELGRVRSGETFWRAGRFPAGIDAVTFSNRSPVVSPLATPPADAGLDEVSPDVAVEDGLGVADLVIGP